MGKLIRTIKNEWPFFALLVLAGFLRFYQIEQIPFHHDELSALTRLQFNGLSELLRLGVEPDFHPAFTQVFLYFWGKAFGTGPFITRLPFVLSALGSLVILYQLQKELFGKPAGYLAMAVLAAGQLFIFDSVMARPYAFGLLFTSALAYVVYRISKPDKRKIGLFASVAILLALTAYTHYFAVLTAAIVYYSGFLFIDRSLWIKYFLSGAASLLLFVPHLGITLSQLSRGGIGGPDGWLGVPEPDAFIRFLSSAVNFSTLVMIFVLAGALIGGAYAVAKKKYFALNFIIWPILIYLFGYFYSVHVNPIMHEQTVVFVVQFLILSATAAFQVKNRVIQTVIPLALAAFVAVNLFVKRDHYAVMKAQPFSWVAEEFDQNPDALVSTVINPAFVRYFSPRFPTSSGNSLLGPSNQEVAYQIENSIASTYIGDGVNYTAEVLARKKYTHTKKRENGFTFTGYLIEKGTPNAEDFGDYLVQKNHSLPADSSEYFNLLRDTLSSGWDISSEVLAHVEFEDHPPTGLMLVMELKKNGESFMWKASATENDGVHFGDGYVLVNGALFWNYTVYPDEIEGLELLIYIWNPQKEPYNLRYSEVYRRHPNPNRYGLLLPRP